MSAARPFARAPWRWSLVLLAALFLALNHGLLTGAAAGRWDADAFFAPYQMLVADHARAGRFLLWNPWCNGGSPDFAEPQVGAFSPLAVLTGLLTGGSEAGFRVYWLIVWFTGGAGLLVLGRHLGAPPWGALAVALGYLFSGYCTGHAEHVSWLVSLAWLPFLVWRLDVALESGRLRPAAEAGLFWGLSGLGGYPGHVLLNGGFAFLWALGRATVRDDSARPRVPARRVAWTLVLLVAVGLVLMAPTYVGLIVEGRGFSGRTEPLPREMVVTVNALHPRALATLTSPYLAELPAERLWPYTDISSCSVYLGPLVPWLGLLALLLRPRARFRAWIAGLGLLALGCALAQVLPLRGWLYDLLPPTRFFRNAVMFRGYAMFALLVLALLASADLARELASAEARRMGGVRRLGAALACAVAAPLVFHLTLARVPEASSTLASLQVWLVWPALVLVALLARRGGARTLVPALLALALVDAALTRRLSVGTLETVRPEILAEWRTVDAGHRGALELGEPGLARALRARQTKTPLNNKNFAEKLAVLESYAPFKNEFHLRWVQEPVLVAAATGPDRFWFASEAPEVAPDAATFEAFVARARALGAPPLVRHSRAALLETPGDAALASDAAEVAVIRALPAARRVPITLVRYTPMELELTVDCPGEGWFLATERWARGWRAEVDGRAVPLEGGAFLFRAVAVHAGTNRVRFRYHPFGWPWLALLSWGTFLALGAGALGAALRRPRAPAPVSQ